MAYKAEKTKKKLEGPDCLIYSYFAKKHNNINQKGLKWTMSGLPPIHKTTFMHIPAITNSDSE